MDYSSSAPKQIHAFLVLHYSKEPVEQYSKFVEEAILEVEKNLNLVYLYRNKTLKDFREELAKIIMDRLSLSFRCNLEFNTDGTFHNLLTKYNLTIKGFPDGISVTTNGVYHITRFGFEFL